VGGPEGTEPEGTVPECTVPVGAGIVDVVLVVEVDGGLDAVVTPVDDVSFEQAASTTPATNATTNAGRGENVVRRLTRSFSQTLGMGLWSVGQRTFPGQYDRVIRDETTSWRRPLVIVLVSLVVGVCTAGPHETVTITVV
jgi:hypothetical protein